MSREPHTASNLSSEILEEAAAQVSKATPKAVVELIALQIHRAREAFARVEEEGQIVRDIRGAAVPHPAIEIEKAATKLAADLIERYRGGGKSKAKGGPF